MNRSFQGFSVANNAANPMVIPLNMNLINRMIVKINLKERGKQNEY
jgi:hypothetical protein